MEEIRKHSNRLYSIDAVKFFCAIGIIFIHTEIWHKEIFDIFDRTAVPLFFMFSGYFMSTGNIEYKCKRIIYKIVPIYIYAIFIYFVAQLFIGYSCWSVLNEFSLVEFLLYGHLGWAGHLWYLHAYIYVVVLFFILSKLSLFDKLVVIMPIFILLNFLYGCYANTNFLSNNTFPLFIYSRNPWFAGIPLVSIGYILGKYKISFLLQSKYKRNILLSLIFLMIPISYIDYFFLSNKIVRDLTVSNFVLSILICLYTLSSSLSDNLFAKLGRKYSLNIYIFHPLILIFLMLFSAKFIQKDIFQINEYFTPFIPILLSIATLITLYIFSKIKSLLIDRLA